MKRLFVLVVIVAALAFPAVAFADYGSYTDRNGLWCSWSGFSGMSSVDCSGTILRTGRFYSYHCDVYSYGYSSNWDCMDMNGNTWHGSR